MNAVMKRRAALIHQYTSMASGRHGAHRFSRSGLTRASIARSRDQHHDQENDRYLSKANGRGQSRARARTERRSDSTARGTYLSQWLGSFYRTPGS